MIRIFTKSIICTLIGVFLLGFNSALGQTPIGNPEAFGIQEFLKAGEADASTLVGHYLEPFFKGLGYGATNGWYNTAKAHKTLGFDLTVSASLAKTPNGDYVYEFIESEYQTLKSASGNSTTASSVFGDENQSIKLLSSYKDENGIPINAVINTPPGIGLEDKTNGYVLLPILQLGVGLIKNTDLKIRWMPTQKNSDYGTETSLIGFGLMHDFKQWIPGIKHLPIDMSILIAYNRINTSITFKDTASGGLPGDNQKAEFGINAWTYQVLVSKKLSILTIYGGLGYNSVNTNLDVTGTFVIQDEDTLLPVTVPEVKLTNPVFEKFSSSGVRGTAGIRLKLAVITLHADYTFQEHNTITAGIGISIR